ncbi:hypothetical protein ABT040_01890 [Streptomyces sp. NPDC002688]|uniref:hypothetical protein n=1 Tax=Streptomyces sp. NPDC002688 TaxID=3154423 RepID=UPI00332C18F6
MPVPTDPSETDPRRAGLQTEAEETDAEACHCVPGLCWCDEADKERYAKLEIREACEDYEDCENCEYGEDCESDDGRVLRLVDAYPGGMEPDPSYDLNGQLPPDIDTCSLRGLIVLTEIARARLAAESWGTEGAWHLSWSVCGSEIGDPLDESKDIDLSGGDADAGSGGTGYCATIRNDDALILEIVGTRRGDRRVFYREPLAEPDGEPHNTGTPDGLRRLLDRATEQTRGAGYEADGDWNVDWSRCSIDLHVWYE